MGEVLFTTSAGYGLMTMNIPKETIGAEGDSVFPILKIPTQLIGKKHKYYKVIPINLQGKLFLGNQLLSIMKSVSHNLDLWSNSNESPLELHFPITLRAIEFIELKRKEGINFKIAFDFQYLYFEEENSYPNCEISSSECNFTIPQSDWVKNVLPNIGFDKQLLIEIPIPEIEELNITKISIPALIQAQKHFNNSLYDEAVGSCRLALEPFFEKKELDGKPRKVLQEKWKNNLGESTFNWLNEAMLAVNEPTNKPHHSPNNHYNRNEAQIILMITTGLVSFIARENFK